MNDTEPVAEILLALAAAKARGDIWLNPQPHCAACEGIGSIQAYAFRSWRWRDCWECAGTGNHPGGNAPTERDLSFDE